MLLLTFSTLLCHKVWVVNCRGNPRGVACWGSTGLQNKKVFKKENSFILIFYPLWQLLELASSIKGITDSDSYRFSAHWAKIKCSICSSKFDRFERVHATLPMIKRLFGQGSDSGTCPRPVMGRLGIAVPPRTAHTHPLYGSVSSYYKNDSTFSIIGRSF